MPMSPRDRRSLIILGVVVVLAAAAFFLFVRKGDKTPTTALPQVNVNQGVTQPTPSPSPTAKEKHKKVLVFSGRDPFCCQPTLALVSSASLVGGVAPAGTPSFGPSGGSSNTFDGQTIVLIDIFTDGGTEQAQVEVDGTVYTVSPGDSFAGDFALVSIDGTCADFTFQSESFTLCETANK
jgi:hypothetical protein